MHRGGGQLAQQDAAWVYPLTLTPNGFHVAQVVMSREMWNLKIFYLVRIGMGQNNHGMGHAKTIISEIGRSRKCRGTYGFGITHCVCVWYICCDGVVYHVVYLQPSLLASTQPDTLHGKGESSPTES